MERTPLTHHVLELPGLQKHGRSNKTLTGKRPVPNTSRNCKVVLTIKFSMGKVEWLARQRREIEGGVAEMAKLTANQQWAIALAWATLQWVPHWVI